MRKRFNTIFAETQEEFISEMERSDILEDERNSADNLMKRQRVKSKLSEVIEESSEIENETERGNSDDREGDLLGATVEYKLKTIVPLISELEKMDEENLICNLAAMNNYYKFRDEKNFRESVSTLRESLGERNHETECQSTLSTNVSSSSSESMLSQNLVVSKDRIKLMIIGDRGVGKTSLANILTRSITNRHKYEPTQSLDIKKDIYYSKNTLTNISIELWDTNSLILNSKLIQTYFKICDGFILICDLSNTDSIRFLEKMIENIINFSPTKNFDNIQIYANMREDLNLDEYQFNLDILSKLVESFQLGRRVIYTNLHEYSIDKDELIDNFFNNCLSAKMSKGSSRQMSKGDNSEYIQILSSINVNNSKKIQMQAKSAPSPQTITILNTKKSTASSDKEANCMIY